MESAKPPTSSTKMLLLLWVLWLCGATNGSPLAQRELQMLEMMRNILGVDSTDLSGRSQRSSPMMFAASVPCDDSLPEEANDNFSLFEEEDLEESEECGDYGQPCDDRSDQLEPCPRPLLPMEHPCFVRVIVLRTPMMRHDPCNNFTLGMALPAALDSTTSSPTSTTTTTSTTQKPKTKKCKTKKKKNKVEAKGVNSNTTSNPTTTTTAAQPDTEPQPETTDKMLLARVLNTTTTTPETTTENDTTITTTLGTTTEEPMTTTTTEPTTTKQAPTTTEASYYYRNQLKSLRGKKLKEERKKKKKKGKPSVPDMPKNKLDGAMQSSDTFPVFQTTEIGELRARPEALTTTEANLIETTTTDCVEDTSEVETSTEHHDEHSVKASGKETEEISGSEDCEDAEDQDTNLCPQFSNPNEPANIRRAPNSRYRKPVKNYVEPILYEGQFAKPRQRIGMLQPPQRDYFVTNKQIMPRPRPKYREPVPHSIYMNNIVRGLKCSDEVDTLNHPPLPKHYRPGKGPTGGPQRIWMTRRPGYRPGEGYGSGGDYGSRGSGGYRPGGTVGYGSNDSPSPSHGPQHRRRNPLLYGLSSGEDLDAFGHDSDQYYDDGSVERHSWSREQPLPSLGPEVDPCQVEHRQEKARERERERQKEREREHDRDIDYQQPVVPRFFT